LVEQKVLVVQGSGFNWHDNNHLRIVFLPAEDELKEAISRIGQFLDQRRGS
jgi:alanine-synthesizing transaminase